MQVWTARSKSVSPKIRKGGRNPRTPKLVLYEAGRMGSCELGDGVEDEKSGSVLLMRSMMLGQKAPVGAGAAAGGGFEEEARG